MLQLSGDLPKTRTNEAMTQWNKGGYILLGTLVFRMKDSRPSEPSINLSVVRGWNAMSLNAGAVSVFNQM
jgi:hypothetical protein